MKSNHAVGARAICGVLGSWQTHAAALAARSGLHTGNATPPPAGLFDPIDLEAALNDTLSSYVARPPGRAPANLVECIRYSLLSRGARIRARLVLGCGRMLGVCADALLPPALSFEMLHCATLIQDDLPSMDNDSVRRGQPSNHLVYGEALAILASDALLALSYEVFLEAAEYLAPKPFARGLRTFAWAQGPQGLAGGQAAELLLRRKPARAAVEEMQDGKTGALFVAALRVPQAFADIEDDSPAGHAIGHLAAELGRGFQIADDLEDRVAPDPTNILYYASPDEVRASTHSRLAAAMARVSDQWGERARPLGDIVGEVIRKLDSSPAK